MGKKENTETDVEKMVKAINRDDSKAAQDLLDKILREKVAKRIDKVLGI